jgi:RNA polymerase sigma-70 factor (ECF subfamily)
MHAIYARDMRSQNADNGVDDPAPEPAPGSGPIGPLQLRELERALAQLGPEQRSVLLLVTLEGMSYEQVASSLGVSVGTVIARLARARRKLRALLLAAPKLTVVK